MLKADNIVSNRQYQIAVSFSWIIIFLLVLRYFQIQIIQYEKYSSKSYSNRIRKVTKNAPRGLILDRNGEILVDNYPVYVLTAIPGEMSDKGKQFKLISDYINSDSIIINSNYKKYYRGRFVPTRLAKDLDFSQLSNLEENKLNLEGVYYDQIPERFYPSKANAPHLFGYVKEVDRTIRKNLVNRDLYELGDLVGWSGLEKQYESFLMGQRGTYFFEVDASGREVGSAIDLKNSRPDPGYNIQTTIQNDIQIFIEEIMQNRKGSILVGDPKSGGVIAATSAPGYPPELFTGLMTESDWNTIQNDKDHPLINRYIQGTYPPGSIVKMITQAAALKYSNFDSNILYDCPGFYQFGDRIYGCWVSEGHGEINLKQAISYSCDVYFYKIIQFISLNQLHDMFIEFGFGNLTNIDIPNEVRGLVPNRKYMQKRYGRYGWSKGSLLNFAIGQGELLVTPIQILNFINLIATRGSAPSCHFVMVNNLPKNSIPDLNKQIWDEIHEGMLGAIIDVHGTGRKSNPNIKELKVYGKTGTAENPHGKSHAWYAGWAENKSNIYSVAILLENAGSGGKIAAPIAKDIYQKLFNDKPLVLK